MGGGGGMALPTLLKGKKGITNCEVCIYDRNCYISSCCCTRSAQDTLHDHSDLPSALDADADAPPPPTWLS